MRRLLLVFAAMAVMVAMMLASAMPALAAPPADKPGQYTCSIGTPTGQLDTVTNVPQGQTATYEVAGYQCSKNNQ